MTNHEMDTLRDRSGRMLRAGIIMIIMAVSGCLLTVILSIQLAKGNEGPWIIVAFGWFALWTTLGIVAVIRSGNLQREYGRKVAEALDMPGLLKRHCQPEVFEFEKHLSEETLGRFDVKKRYVGGRNYFRTQLDGRALEASVVELGSDGVNDSYSEDYRGQMAVLVTRTPYPGRLLLTRPKGWAGHRMHDDYWREVYPIGGFGCTTKKKRAAKQVSLPEDMEERWLAYADNPNAAAAVLARNPELCRRLMDAVDLVFVIYDGDSVLFGGHYDFELSKGTPDEMRDIVEKALDGLFNEAIPAVDAMTL